MITAHQISSNSKIYYVDDGSQDTTWQIIQARSQTDSQVVGLKLSCNKGHQNALLAGLQHTSEDITVSIDADLQDNPNNISLMVNEYLKGNEIVYGVRSKRDSDTFFKKFTAESYYKIMQKMGVDLVFNHADFRLMSRVALNALSEYGETNLFLRGLAREVGFKYSTVEYERTERVAGESKYPLRKMLSFAWEGISSFSTAPLRAITVLGFAAGAISLAMILWVLGTRLFTEGVVPGWASILVPLLFIGSVQLMCLGVIGEYLAKIYAEVKQRPKYHIEQKTQTKKNDKP